MYNVVMEIDALPMVSHCLSCSLLEYNKQKLIYICIQEKSLHICDKSYRIGLCFCYSECNQGHVLWITVARVLWLLASLIKNK